jgi:WD40 repeat protein
MAKSRQGKPTTPPPPTADPSDTQATVIVGLTQRPTLQYHFDTISSIAWSPDGCRLASTARDGSLRIWEPDASADPIFIAIPLVNSPMLAWSANGARLAVATTLGISVHDATTGEVIWRCNPKTATSAIAWSPARQLLATGSQEGIDRAHR